jgi:hypothetical protein
MAAWCKYWNIKINEEKTPAIYLSQQARPSGTTLTMNGRTIPFVNSGKYFGAIFDRKITRTLHIETATTKAKRTFFTL